MPQPSSAPQPTPQTTASAEIPETICYRKLDANPLAALAHFAPTLKEAELRVALALATSANHQLTTTASSRAIAKQTRLARSAVISALHSLATRGLIATRQGSATRPGAHLLNFLATERWSSCRTTPGPTAGPPLVLQQGHPGLFPDPPPEANTTLPAAPAPVEEDSSILTIDRLLRARPRDFDLELLLKAKNWLQGYVAKLGPDPHPHPPDDRITAQFLAVAPWPQLEHLLYDLLADRNAPGHSYAWFVSVALQRLHGIHPTRLADRRAQLKLLKPAPQTPRGENYPLPDVAAIAAAKSFR